MRKKFKNLKVVFVLLLIGLINKNSMAAIIADNDGAAFVTKAEFETLKKDFSEQIDNYNQSIDNRIDGAISNYFAGIRTSKKEIVKLNKSFQWTFPIICLNNSEWNNKNSTYYGYELPDYQIIEMSTRGCSDRAAAGLDWNSTSMPSSGSGTRATNKGVEFNKQWQEMKDIYNEMLKLNDKSVTRVLNGTSITCWNVENIGKGRHKIERFSHSGTKDAGHVTANGKYAYWGYSGILGIGYNGTRAYRNQMTTSTFANWTPGTWTNANGVSHFSCLGWGYQTNRAFAKPADGLDLDGARTWAANYTDNNATYCHDQANLGGYKDTAKTSIKWKDDMNKVRSWAFTGNSDAPATSECGWYFNFQKPNSATEKFEGYVIKYSNDLAMATVEDGTWYGFHSWAPAWYWRYTAGGSIGSKPSESEFSKLPAKQIYYYDENNNIHYMDEGLFLFNMPGTPEETEFDAKWEVLDTSVATTQKIRLKISSTPFSSEHDDTKNLKYTVDGGDEKADQEIVCGTSKKIKVKCDEYVKQLYMMWEPITAGTYLGLTELSDFTVTIE